MRARKIQSVFFSKSIIPRIEDDVELDVTVLLLTLRELSALLLLYSHTHSFIIRIYIYICIYVYPFKIYAERSINHMYTFFLDEGKEISFLR